MIPFKAPGAIRAEILESRRLLSAPGIVADSSPAIKEPPATLAGTLAVMNAATVYPLSDCPQLASKPGAPATIYLDFTGDTSATWGTYAPGTTPAYDTDGDPTTFSSTELANIQSIWNQFADTYSPFNVNVTTINPGNNNNPNLEVVIGGSGAWTKGTPSGGVAYVGSFAGTLSNYGANKNKVFVFPANLGGGYPRYVADDAEHEAGHAFGLTHQSIWAEITTTTPPTYTLTAEYNTGTPAGGPIMGNPLNDTRAMWWDGTADYESGGAPFIQDDMSIIASAANGFGYSADDYGNSIASAYTLSGTTSFAANGTIGTNGDTDFFAFTVFPGSTTITVTPGAPLSDPNPTLNAKLQLFNSSGSLIASATQTTLAKSITTTLAGGTYYAEVSGDGSYGDVGEYALTIAASPASPDRYEPNDTFAQATDLGPVVNQTQTGMSINAPNNDDYYSFIPVGAGALSASISFVSTSGNLDLYLYDQNQNLLASSTSTGADTQSVSDSVVAGQTYYLRVAGASGAINPYYSLSIVGAAPSWLTDVSGLTYTYAGTSSSPTLSITGGTGLLSADASTLLGNLGVSVAPGAALEIQTTQHLASLQLLGNATVQILKGSNAELITNSLQMSSTSSLDLTDNSLVWYGASQSAVQALLDSGYAAGTWAGPGISSSTAAIWTYCGLGYSNTIVPGAVLVKYALDGDTNMDGSINADDMSLIALGEKNGGTTWQAGDFNYDQKVTEDDFLLLSVGLAHQGVSSNWG